MSRLAAITVGLLLSCSAVLADDEAADSNDAEAIEGEAVEQEAVAKSAGVSPDQPKTMSGMSILGNEEAPKSLVIVPWKGSELGNDISLNDSLDERARPVDRDVFERELRYYSIRSGAQN
ncbi:MAG: hypothetical protein OEW35_00565 [Gammaproteobacteria bacterium]|nr:hypothetical protein [Gammaproteobacteria bacterium]MDH4254768.1 hypothetical protein [Gammaproteobacteria bacterium]MDH5308320.1 hypothetical protein [Gammaproteobacteria bacterium]